MIASLKEQIEYAESAKKESAGEIFTPSRSADDVILSIEKSRAYNSLNEEVDKILAYAKTEAERIISSAEEAARTIGESSARNVRAMKEDISTKSSSIIDEIKAIIKSRLK